MEIVSRTGHFTVTRESLLSSSVKVTQHWLFGQNCPILTARLAEAVERRYSRDLDYWKFLDLIAQSRLKEKKEAMDLLVFEIFDGDCNGFINIVDIYDLITIKETKGLVGIHTDLKRIKRELQEKAINGPKDELETAINFRRFQLLVPHPTFFDVIQASLHSNYQRRKDLVRRCKALPA